MAKSKNSMNDYLTRIRGQAATAHADDTPTQPEVKEESKRVSVPSLPIESAPEKPSKPTPQKRDTKPKRRRSIWGNPYPDAQPHQTTIYTCDEDALLVQQLRLKLRYSKDWMVYKYALEELAKREGIS
jgi:hypothetical protein